MKITNLEQFESILPFVEKWHEDFSIECDFYTANHLLLNYENMYNSLFDISLDGNEIEFIKNNKFAKSFAIEQLDIPDDVLKKVLDDDVCTLYDMIGCRKITASFIENNLYNIFLLRGKECIIDILSFLKFSFETLVKIYENIEKTDDKYYVAINILCYQHHLTEEQTIYFIGFLKNNYIQHWIGIQNPYLQVYFLKQDKSYRFNKLSKEAQNYLDLLGI
jgi:hypothetical protein